MVRREKTVVIAASDRPAFKVGDVVHKINHTLAARLSNGVLYERLQTANVSIRLFNATKPPVAKCSKIRMSKPTVAKCLKIRMSKISLAIRIEIQRLDGAGLKGTSIRNGLKALFPELGDVGISSSYG
jgi:hypothetical protein